MLSSLDFSIVVFNGCIKHTYLKWALKSHQPLSIIITQKKLRGHAADQISHNFVNHPNWLLKSLYEYFEPADLVTFTNDLW